MSAELRARRLALTQALMEDIGLKDESRLDDKGRAADPGLYWKALHELWEHLGPEGRAELDRQAGIDAFGNIVPSSVKDLMDAARAVGHDMLGLRFASPEEGGLGGVSDVIVDSQTGGGQPETTGEGPGQGPLRDMCEEATVSGEQDLRGLPGERQEEQGEDDP